MSDLLASFGINWKLLIIQAINFGFLLVVLTYLLYKPILRILDERRSKIEQGVKSAEEADLKLARAEKDAREMVAEASIKADEIIKKSKRTAEVEREKIIEEANERSEKIKKDALLRAEELAKRTMDENNKEIARVAILAAERLLRKKLS